MLFLYSLGIRLYHVLIHLVFPFNRSARKWILGRKDLFNKLQNFKPLRGKTIWIHCASLGEFEQARPLIEELKNGNDIKVLLTFFSPSGYDIRKNYPLADFVSYLPIDFKSNAVKFLDIVKPDIVVFVKYEFWFNFINETGKRGIPLYLISGIFRDNHFLFKSVGKKFHSYLNYFTHFYLQDEKSALLLKENGFDNVTVAGDTRFDRVLDVAANTVDIPLVKEFVKGSKVLVVGSTWEPDEDILKEFFYSETVRKHKLKLIIAPHHIDKHVIERIEHKFPDAVRFSKGSAEGKSVLVIDNIGMLSALYRYGDVAYVGGGFGVAVHNVLEPAAYGIPVIFGPENAKFREIQMLKKEQIGFEIHNVEDLRMVVESLLDSPERIKDLSFRINQFMKKNAGAVDVISRELKSLLLHTSEGVSFREKVRG